MGAIIVDMWLNNCLITMITTGIEGCNIISDVIKDKKVNNIRIAVDIDDNIQEIKCIDKKTALIVIKAFNDSISSVNSNDIGSKVDVYDTK